MRPRTDPSDRLVWRAEPADSDTVVVAFSGWGVMPGRFNFFGLREHLPQASKLLVRDPSHSWYNAGLPEVGETVDEIAARMREKVRELGGRRVISIGSSMGGYASILFGCKIGAERAIAFVPQTLLHPDLPIGPPPDLRLQVPDLAPVVREAPRTSIDLVLGWDLLSDVFHAQRIAGAPSVRMLGASGGHSFAQELRMSGDYWPFLLELIAGRVPAICDVKSPLAPAEVERIEDAVFAHVREDWRQVEERIGPLAERHPAWAAPNLALGEALAGMGEWRRAELALARAVSASPRWDRPRDALVQALMKQGRWAAAEKAIRDGIAVDSTWWRGRAALGECLLRLGRNAEARSAALDAERLIREGLAVFPTFAKGHLSLGWVLLQLEQTEEARSAVRRAVELNPRLADSARELLTDPTG